MIATTFTELSRRNFLKSAAIAGGSLLLVSLAPRRAQAASLRTTIARNHGHVFAADLATVLANGPRSYDISGNSHFHELTLTAEILATLQRTRVVDVESSKDSGHTHIVRFEIL